MNNRQLAIQELYQGLISKYGINPNAKRLISAEIQRFSQSKSKISVEDIEKLEEEIKKLCNISKPLNSRPKISVSTSDVSKTYVYFKHQSEILQSDAETLYKATYIRDRLEGF